MVEEKLSNILCNSHINEISLEDSVLIYCIVCSQIKDENTRRFSDYEKAKLCASCASNTGICAICEEPLESY